MTPLFFGIDTSNYTTSAALVDGEGTVYLNRKCPLPVRDGERGLRQSDAVFHHVRNLPLAAEDVGKVLSSMENAIIAAAGVSSAPRDAEGSYMPCFLAGEAAASMASEVGGYPLFRFSHQAGHVMAAVNSVSRTCGISKRRFLENPFLAFHVSGGTTDLLLAEPLSEPFMESDKEKIFKLTALGTSKDLHAGQVLDRTGVKMGMRFPCGAEMDRLAQAYTGSVPKSKIFTDGCDCCLSGLENQAEALWEREKDPALVSAFVLEAISRTLLSMTDAALEKAGRLPVIYAGGVMSSAYIKKRLEARGYFAGADCSSDNAVGVACLAAETYRRRNRFES